MFHGIGKRTPKGTQAHPGTPQEHPCTPKNTPVHPKNTQERARSTWANGFFQVEPVRVMPIRVGPIAHVPSKESPVDFWSLWAKEIPEHIFYLKNKNKNKNKKTIANKFNNYNSFFQFSNRTAFPGVPRRRGRAEEDGSGGGEKVTILPHQRKRKNFDVSSDDIESIPIAQKLVKQ